MPIFGEWKMPGGTRTATTPLLSCLSSISARGHLGAQGRRLIAFLSTLTRSVFCRSFKMHKPPRDCWWSTMRKSHMRYQCDWPVPVTSAFRRGCRRIGNRTRSLRPDVVVMDLNCQGWTDYRPSAQLRPTRGVHREWSSCPACSGEHKHAAGTGGPLLCGQAVQFENAVGGDRIIHQPPGRRKGSNS